MAVSSPPQLPRRRTVPSRCMYSPLVKKMEETDGEEHLLIDKRFFLPARTCELPRQKNDSQDACTRVCATALCASAAREKRATSDGLLGHGHARPGLPAAGAPGHAVLLCQAPPLRRLLAGARRCLLPRQQGKRRSRSPLPAPPPTASLRAAAPTRAGQRSGPGCREANRRRGSDCWPRPDGACGSSVSVTAAQPPRRACLAAGADPRFEAFQLVDPPRQGGDAARWLRRGRHTCGNTFAGPRLQESSISTLILSY